MNPEEIRKKVQGLDNRGTQRLLALLLLDSTVRVRGLLADPAEQACSVDKLSRANELAHTIAGYFLSAGDKTRFPADRISDLISSAEAQGLIDWSSFQTRAFAQDNRLQ
jgi:hypothetical protein